MSITTEQIYAHCYYCIYYSRPKSHNARDMHIHGLIDNSTDGACAYKAEEQFPVDEAPYNRYMYLSQLLIITTQNIAKCKLLDWREISKYPEDKPNRYNHSSFPHVKGP